MKENRKAEERAQNRYKIISPVLLALDERADAAKLAQIKREACEQNGVSRRTLMRWVASHQKSGFSGLKPTPRKNGASILPEEIIQEAILLRREVPMRSVRTIIDILEIEGKAPQGLIKESTLHEKLMERGFSARHMKLYQQKGIGARRFARRERNDLWQSDIKFGPYVMAGGKKKQIYLIAFIDDATRYVIHAEFYPSLEQSMVEKCLRTAIHKEGVPKSLYFDNGLQFKNKWMARACAMLDVKLLFAKPNSPESKGKVERFNRTVDAFLAEASLQNLSTLDSYNKYLNVWISECYHNKVHAALKDTPANAYRNGKTPLRFAEPGVLADAFLHFESRKVDKSGCVSLKSRFYEVSPTLAGSTVDILYDPQDMDAITVKHAPSGFDKRVPPLVIGTRVAQRPKLPPSILPANPGSSRLLDAKKGIHDKKSELMRSVIRYGDMGGASDV